MKKRIITALLVTTASAPALATYPASQPAQAAEVMVRMCLQQRTGVDKKTAIGRVYDTVSDWPIASTTGWKFAVQNSGAQCEKIYLVMIDMLAGKTHLKG